jgi:hypothetical protein
MHLRVWKRKISFGLTSNPNPKRAKNGQVILIHRSSESNVAVFYMLFCATNLRGVAYCTQCTIYGNVHNKTKQNKTKQNSN